MTNPEPIIEVCLQHPLFVMLCISTLMFGFSYITYLCGEAIGSSQQSIKNMDSKCFTLGNEKWILEHITDKDGSHSVYLTARRGSTHVLTLAYCESHKDVEFKSWTNLSLKERCEPVTKKGN